MAAFASVEDYRLDACDDATPEARVRAALEQQSAKLRAFARISEDRELTEDQAVLARMLVTDAARKALVPVGVQGADEVPGATEGSFSANGFEQSWKLAGPSGSAYFDRETLRAFMRSLGRAQSMGTVLPSYGGIR